MIESLNINKVPSFCKPHNFSVLINYTRQAWASLNDNVAGFTEIYCMLGKNDETRWEKKGRKHVLVKLFDLFLCLTVT